MTETITPQEEFIEENGILFENMGIGRTPGRIIGALMINDPPFMNMKELVATTSMSKGSISTSLTMLSQIGFVDKFSIPSERPDYYRIDSEFWSKAMMTKMNAMQGFRESLGKAIEIINQKKKDKHPERTQTLEEMFAMYQFFEERLPKLFVEWDKIRRNRFG